MRSPFSRAFRDAAGASLTEFALVSPFVLLLVAGIVDVGRYMWGGIVVSNAARAGALYGAQSNGNANNSAGIQLAAKADATALPALSVSPSPFCACDSAPGTAVSCTAYPCTQAAQQDVFISVTASYQFKPLIQWPGLPSSLTITKTNTEQVSATY